MSQYGPPFCRHTSVDQRQCLLHPGHAGAHLFPLSEKDQWAAYEIAAAIYQREYEAWKLGGKVGPPPPHPVRPHTPGPHW